MRKHGRRGVLGGKEVLTAERTTLLCHDNNTVAHRQLLISGEKVGQSEQLRLAVHLGFRKSRFIQLVLDLGHMCSEIDFLSITS